MSAVIEVRTYQAEPGMRGPLLELLRSRGFPLHRQFGIRVLGPFPSHDDDLGFVWLRGFPDEASRHDMKARFYESHEWLDELEAEIMPMIAHVSAVVIDDTEDMWSRWPADRGP